MKHGEASFGLFLISNSAGFVVKIVYCWHSILFYFSEGRQCKDCSSTTWYCKASCGLLSRLYRLFSA